MAFDPRLLEARMIASPPLSDDFPAIAGDALEAGFDGPSIRRMAGMVRPTGYEIDLLLPSFLEELGIKHLSPEAAAIYFVRDIAIRVIDHGEDPLQRLYEIERIWIRADHPEAVTELAMLADELAMDKPFRREEERIRECVLREFRLLRDLET